MKSSLHPLWLAMGLALPMPPALAQADTLPTIVVSASRIEQNSIETPASISIITHQEIERSGAQNLPQLLEAYGGIQINSLYGNASGATLDLRGFGGAASRNTLVLVDGRRLNNSADLASPDLNSIDLSRVERIEVVQGSAGTLYGNQAVGGMVNIITRRPEAFSASVEAGLGSHRGRSRSAHLSRRIVDALSFRLSASKHQSDNYRNNNESDRKDANLRFDYEHDSGELFLELQQVDDYMELPGSLFQEEMRADRRQSAAAYAGDFNDLRSNVTRLGMSQELGRYWRFEAEASYRHNDGEFQTSFRSFSCAPSTQERKVKGFNPRVVANLPLTTGEATLTLGADLERTEYRLLSCLGPQNNDQSVDALYGQLTAPLNTDLSATLGWRRGRVDNDIVSSVGNARLDDDLHAGSLGLVYRPEARLRLFARADQNYRFATVDEHTNVFYGQPLGLNNQTGVSYETGAEWQDSRWHAKAVLYRLDLEDEISFDSSGFYNINLDRTRRRGAILEARWQASPQLSLAGSFTYTDPTITSGPYKGNRIPLVSSRSARLSLEWTPIDNWQLYAENRLHSARTIGSDFANAFDILPGYGLLNLGGHYTQGHWRFGLRVDNLLDKTYISTGEVGYDAGFSAREAYFPAPERTLWLSARYQFE